MFQITVDAKGEGEGLDPVKHVKPLSNVILTVQMRYFCCGSSLLFYRLDKLAMWPSSLLPAFCLLFHYTRKRPKGHKLK